MNGLKARTPYLLAGLSLLILVGFAFSRAGTADERAFLPADRVTAAVQTTVSDTPGKVGGVEVETEGGQTLVESYVQTQGGQVSEVAVNLQTNQVVRHEGEDEEEESY